MNPNNGGVSGEAPKPPEAGNPNPIQGTGSIADANPLSDLEKVVEAAQEAAATVPQTPTPGTTPAETPAKQFEKQFGSGITPPVAEEVSELKPEDSADVPVAPLDPNINTVDDLLAKGPQTVEAEKTPADKLKKEIADSVEAFLAEVTKKEEVPV